MCGREGLSHAIGLLRADPSLRPDPPGQGPLSCYTGVLAEATAPSNLPGFVLAVTPLAPEDPGVMPRGICRPPA